MRKKEGRKRCREVRRHRDRYRSRWSGRETPSEVRQVGKLISKNIEGM